MGTSLYRSMRKRLVLVAAMLTVLATVGQGLAAAEPTTASRPADSTIDTADDGVPADQGPTPDEVTKMLAAMSDDDVYAVMDQAAKDAEASLEDPEVTDEEAEQIRIAIDQLSDPDGRKALLAEVRAADPSKGEPLDDDSGTQPKADPSAPGSDSVDADDMVRLPEVPASEPLGAPSPSAPAATPVPVETAPLALPPSGGTWSYDLRTTDRPSYAEFRSLYDQWWKWVQVASVAKGEESNLWIEPFDSCTGAKLGTRSAPTTATRPGTVFTPTTDTFAFDEATPGQSRAVFVGPNSASNAGQFTTRWVNGQEQFLVEAHVSADPSTNVAFFQPEVSVARIGYPDTTFTPANANVDVLCYAQDAGRLSPWRAYVRAWLPASLLAAPGIQVRVDVTNRQVLFVPPHTLFFGADGATVHLGPKPLDARAVVSNAIGLRVDDSVLVDTDHNTGNDLEGILGPTLADAVTRGINGTSSGPNAVTWSGFPFYGWTTIRQSVVERPVTADLSLARIGGDDEATLHIGLNIGQATFRGSFNGLLTGYNPCYYRHTWYADAAADVVVDVDATNPRRLHPRTTTNVTATAHTRKWGLTNGSWIRPMCHLVGALVRSKMKKSIGRSLAADLQEAFNAGPNSRFDQLLATIDLTTAMQQGTTFPNGNGLTFPTDGGAGWMRTCVPRGCQGGDVALTPDGLEAGLALNAADRKPPSRPRRFPLVYDATTSPTPAELLRSGTDANGRPFSVGVMLRNGFLNQILRALTEGSAGPDSAQPTLAPNGILDQAFSVNVPGATWAIRTAPTVAPGLMDVPSVSSDPNRYQGQLAIPDLRVSINDGSGWADPAIIGVNLFPALDVQTISAQTIDPSLIVGRSSRVLRCHSLLWAICVGVVPAVLDTLVGVVAAQIDTALTNITVPQLSPDFTLANVRLQRRGATLALYADIFEKPRVALSGWYEKPWYGFHATAVFPPGPAVTYTWTVTDLLAPVGSPPVWTGTTTSPDITRNMSELHRIRIRKAGLFNHSKWMRSVRVRVVATQGALSAAGTTDMTMITTIW